MKNIALTTLTTALAVAIDNAGIVTGGSSLTLREWLADANLTKEPVLHHACEGVLDYANHLGLQDAEVPAVGMENTGLFPKHGFDVAIVSALFSIRLAPGDDQMDWDDLVHDLAIHIVGIAKAYEIQTGEAYEIP